LLLTLEVIPDPRAQVPECRAELTSCGESLLATEGALARRRRRRRSRRSSRSRRRTRGGPSLAHAFSSYSVASATVACSIGYTATTSLIAE